MRRKVAVFFRRDRLKACAWLRQTASTIPLRQVGPIVIPTNANREPRVNRVMEFRMAVPFYTVGHSTRPMSEFVDLLRASEVTLVADVRTVPRSRTNPQYNADVLPESLAAYHIGYSHISELGGLRGKQPDVPLSVNAFWKNKSFQLCRLRNGRQLPRRFYPAARPWQSAALHHHVRRVAVVAVPSPNYRRLSYGRRRNGAPLSWPGKNRSGTPDGRSARADPWSSDLSCIKHDQVASP